MTKCADLILVVLATVVLHCPSSCTSEIVPNPRLVNFLRLMSGQFSDSQEVSEDIQNKEAQIHSQMSTLFKPVQVPALPSSLTFLLKEALGNKLHRLFILLVFLDSDGTIRARGYRIAHMEKYSFDTPENEIIAELKEGDLTELRKENDMIFVEVEPNVFSGTYPDFLDYSNNPPNYVGMFTCNSFSAFMPFKAEESASPRPYIVSVINRYSLSVFSDILGDISSIKDPCVCS